MKKLMNVLAVVMVFALLMPTCFAVSKNGKEDFTLHSDVKFGMSVKEAQELEKANGFQVSNKVAGVKLVGKSYTECDAILVEGSIAGFANSSIRYHFDDDELFSATYQLKYSDKEDWTTIHNSLIKKYGNSTLDNDDMLNIKNYIGINGSDAFLYLGRLKLPSSKSDLKSTWDVMTSYASNNYKNVEGWTVKTDDGSIIVIMHTLHSTSSAIDTFNGYAFHQIVYQKYTAEEWKKMQDEISAKKNQMNTERNNDL